MVSNITESQPDRNFVGLYRQTIKMKSTNLKQLEDMIQEIRCNVPCIQCKRQMRRRHVELHNVSELLMTVFVNINTMCRT